MTTLYCAAWVLPVTSPAIADGAIAVEGEQIVAVATRQSLTKSFPHAIVRDFGNSAIIPGLVNAHSHLELTAMRGFLEDEEMDFFAWLKKLTRARLERMTSEDLLVSASWGACEAAKAGVTCVADASDSAIESMKALKDVGLRGTVFQESFGPDPRLAVENVEKLTRKIANLRQQETALVKCGVSPHAPYTVSGVQLEMISSLAIDEQLPVMMHAAETAMEVSLLRDGLGPFANGLRERGIEWKAPDASPIQYLKRHGVLETQPLLAHCIHLDDVDLELLQSTGAKVAHCPKSNAKLGHGLAPFGKMLELEISVGLGSDSVASNNTCDLLEEARFALLVSRSRSSGTGVQRSVSAGEVLRAATVVGARALGLAGKTGELKEGMQADLAVVSLDGTHQIPAGDPVTALIFSSSARDVIATVVAGNEVFRDGQVQNVDEQRLRHRMKEIEHKLRS